ncbi:MAG: trigger factor [Chthoniobacterales bacterium]|nr:trigger factor [Chthoniobacterales bacterium]
MNVTTEQKENCVLDFHIELPPERFNQEWKRIAGEYCRLARIPGFRKGKAPLSAIEKKFSKEIQEEATEKTITAALREILTERKLNLVRYPNIKDVHLNEDHSLRFLATMIVAPELELSEYKGLQVAVERDHVSEERLDEVLEKMREDFAEFINVEGRGLAMGDFAVLDYEGTTTDGKALLDLDPELPLRFVGGKNRWLRLEEKLPIPGLTEVLLGLNPQDSRQHSATFPEDFSEKALAGVTVNYQISLHEIKARQLAPLDDAFAAKVKPGLTVPTLREELRAQLENFLNQQFQNKLRAAVVEALLKNNPCDPPALLVQQESSSILQQVVRENQSRGVSEEEIRAHQQELLASAQKSAEEKVKLNFILNAIAAKEKMTVTPEELNAQLTTMAEHYRMPLKKLVQEVQKNRALSAIEEELLFGKTLAFLTTEAQVTELPPSKAEAAEHVHGPHCNH